MKKVLLTICLVVLMFGVSTNLFAAEAEETSKKVMGVAEEITNNVAETVEDVREMTEGQAAEIIKLVFSEFKEISKGLGETGGVIINKLEPLGNTLVDETGHLYGVRALGCLCIAIALTLVIYVFWKHVVSKTFMLEVKQGNNETKVDITSSLVKNDVQNALLFKTFAKVVCSVLLIFIWWASLHYAFTNASCAVSPTRTLVVELVQASRSNPGSNN